MVDLSAVLFYLGGFVLMMLFGYSLMVVDYRAYMRALRGVLVRVTIHFPRIPNWARYQTPGCLLALGLRLPCSEADVKEAYRSKAESLHPDRGGDRRKFLQLQRQFEQSLQFLKDHEPEYKPQT